MFKIHLIDGSTVEVESLTNPPADGSLWAIGIDGDGHRLGWYPHDGARPRWFPCSKMEGFLLEKVANHPRASEADRADVLAKTRSGKLLGVSDRRLVRIETGSLRKP